MNSVVGKLASCSNVVDMVVDPVAQVRCTLGLDLDQFNFFVGLKATADCCIAL